MYYSATMETKSKNNVVYVNLYVDLVVPPTMTRAEAYAELSHKLNLFAVLNQDLTIKAIKCPESPPDSDIIYLPSNSLPPSLN